ncbi:MAG: hypothetical protein IT447_08720 [Phycisphaerales bacterium]|jgi:hypothetical protein|nr:hypothetical protein [Phycisphaerales bacterium]
MKYRIGTFWFLLLTLLPAAGFARTSALTDLNALWSSDMANMSRKEILSLVTDNVNPDTASKYGFDFEKYWLVTGSSRTGKFAEAEVALKFRRYVKLAGLDYEIMPSALKDNRSAVDLIVRNTLTDEETYYQMKLGRSAAKSALADPKYSGMKIFVPKDTYESILDELNRAKLKATRRGVPLSRYWQAIDDALDSGRLTDTLEGGMKMPAGSTLEKVAKRFTGRQFTKALPHVFDEAEAVVITSRFSRIGGVAFAVADVAIQSWQAYGDISRYNAGKIDSLNLAAHLSARAGMAAAGVYIVAGGPPGWVIGSIIATTIAFDIAISYWDSIQDKQFQAELAMIEKEDRYNVTRAMIIHEWLGQKRQ